jgi:hypothetical protein
MAGKEKSMVLIRFVRGFLEGTHTTTDGLALALASAARAVAAVAVGEEQTGTGGEENCRSSMSIRIFLGVVLECVSK